MTPAPAALRTLRALPRLDQARRRHRDDCTGAAALGRFAGLNILPQKSFRTDDAYRTLRPQQQARLTGWVGALAPRLVPEAKACALDVPPLPYRGDPTGLERHSLPCPGKAAASALTSFALANARRVRCYAHANRTRIDPPGALRRGVAFGPGLTGADPPGRSVDAKLVPSAERARVHGRGIWFGTIRRRRGSLRRRRKGRPATAWPRAVLDPPPRCHQPIRDVDAMGQRRDDVGPVRPRAVDGRGHDEPTSLLSNNVAEAARNVLIRDAGRNRVEDGRGTAVTFVHLDGLAREGRRTADLDTVLTVLANGCERWLGRPRRGFEKAAPPPLDRRCVETAGTVSTEANRRAGHFDRRGQNPILRAAALDRDQIPIPWCHGRSIAFSYL
jgi:hypothetical protein